MHNRLAIALWIAAHLAAVVALSVGLHRLNRDVVGKEDPSDSKIVAYNGENGRTPTPELNSSPSYGGFHEVALIDEHSSTESWPDLIRRAILRDTINSLYADKKRAILGSKAERAYWKDATLTSDEKRALLDIANEERELLSRYLGQPTRWLDPSESFMLLRGLHHLEPSKQEEVLKLKINLMAEKAAFNEKASAAANTNVQGQNSELGRLDRQYQQAFSSLLTDEELHNYELLTNPIAEKLRMKYSIMNLSSNEFADLFNQYRDADVIVRSNAEAGTVSRDQVLGVIEERIDSSFEARIQDPGQKELARLVNNQEFRTLSRFVERFKLSESVALDLWHLRSTSGDNSIESSGRDGQLPRDHQGELSRLLPTEDARRAFAEYFPNWIEYR